LYEALCTYQQKLDSTNYNKKAQKNLNEEANGGV